MHLILDCLCNSRIVQPRNAGHAAAWPLALLWGGQAAAAVSGCLIFVVRRRRRTAGPGGAMPDTAPPPVEVTAARQDADVERQETPV